MGDIQIEFLILCIGVTAPDQPGTGSACSKDTHDGKSTVKEIR
jgi:hypothetical protein